MRGRRPAGTVGATKRAIFVLACAVVALVAALPAGAASARKKHRSCPKGQVHTRQGCRTRLPGATYRSADQRVAVGLTPGAYSETTPIDEVQFGASEVYPY